MKILLVNSAKKSRFSDYKPLALLKLSTKHKNMKDDVEFIDAGNLPKFNPDLIYFSTIFLFNAKKDIGYIRSYSKKYPKSKIIIGGVAVSLMENYYRKYSPENVEIINGLVPELDTYRPDYDIANIKYSYGFTSRGCPNKCPWCVVPKVEGKQFTIASWKNAIDLRFNLFKGMDNNILSCDIGHIEEVFEFLYKNKIKVDFNQAMDCQILMKNENIKKLFIKYKNIWSDIRFAWDSKRCDKYAVETLDFLKKEKIKSSNSCIWYMLYDYNESPLIIFERVKKILKHQYSSSIKLMRYKDLSTGGLLRKWGGIGDDWAHMCQMTVTGLISNADKKINWLFNNDYQTFKKRLEEILSIFRKNGSNGVTVFYKNIIKDINGDSVVF